MSISHNLEEYEVFIEEDDRANPDNLFQAFKTNTDIGRELLGDFGFDFPADTFLVIETDRETGKDVAYTVGYRTGNFAHTEMAYRSDSLEDAKEKFAANWTDGSYIKYIEI